MDVVTCGKNDLPAGSKENATTGKTTFVGIGTKKHCDTAFEEDVFVKAVSGAHLSKDDGALIPEDAVKVNNPNSEDQKKNDRKPLGCPPALDHKKRRVEKSSYTPPDPP